MIKTMTQMSALACGLVVPTRRRLDGSGVRAAATEGDVPGTRVWSPPTC